MKYEVELDDKGDFIEKALPAEIAEAHKRIGIMAHGNGFQAGQAKAGEDAKKQLEAAIAAERARIEASLPLEREKWQAVESENGTLKQQLTDTMREHSRTVTKREEAHADEITKRAAAIVARDQRIKSLVSANVRSMAAAAGARDEELGNVEFLVVNKHIGFDDDMEPFVRGEDGKPLTTNTGTPISVETFVRQFMDNHPTYRKPAPGRGGDARGGASIRGNGGATAPTLAAMQERISNGDRGDGAIHELFEAIRSKRAS